MWQSPITDRTQADVDARNALGTLNASDLNRIEGNSEYLAQELGVSLSTAPTWAQTSIPVESDYQRILSNLGTLMGAVYLPNGAPELPSMPLNSYTQYNTIEQIQLILQERYLDVLADTIFAGEGDYAGGNIGVI